MKAGGITRRGALQAGAAGGALAAIGRPSIVRADDRPIITDFSQAYDRNTPRGVRDWSNSALYNDPLPSLVNQHGPKGQLHQTAIFTGKRKDIAWKAAPSFAMDFRAHNFKLNKG